MLQQESLIISVFLHRIVSLLRGRAVLFVFDALYHARLVLLELALVVRARVLMVEHVPLQDNRIFTVTST